MRIGRLHWAGWLLAVAPWAACAGFIKLDVTPVFDLTNSPPRLTVGVWNEGADPARGVVVEATAADWSAEPTNEVRAIGPDENYDFVFMLPGLPSVPGVYPAILRTRYDDVGGQRFSSVAVDRFCVGGVKPDLWVTPILDSARTTGSAKLTLRMASLEAAPLDVRVRLVLPDAFTCDNAERQVKLAPEAESVEVFEVMSRDALSGGPYSVVAVLENETGGIHRMDVATGALWVEAPVPTPAWRYVMWFAIGAALLAFMAAMQWLARRKT